jgi:hypothetical protein
VRSALLAARARRQEAAPGWQGPKASAGQPELGGGIAGDLAAARR